MILRVLLIVLVLAGFAFAGDNEKPAEKTEGTSMKATKEEGRKMTDAEKDKAKKEEKEEPKEHVTDSGLKYVILKDGDGASPKKGETVVVHYTGTLTDGKKFDSSVDRGQPFQFQVGMGKVIKGWDEALMMMQVGDKWKLIIPSDLAYGDRGYPGVIPPKATLIFVVELLDIK